MYADELVKIFRPKLNEYYFDILCMWLAAHKEHGIFKRKTKFDVEPTMHLRGYVVRDLNRFDSVIVYDKTSDAVSIGLR